MRMQSALRAMSFALTCIVTTAASGHAQTANPTADPLTRPAVVTPNATRPQPGGSATDAAPTRASSSDPELQVGPVSPQDRSTLASNDEQLGTALVLLEHIQSVLDEATVGKNGTISLDPGVVDQLRAEVAAVRLALRKEQSQP